MIEYCGGLRASAGGELEGLPVGNRVGLGGNWKERGLGRDLLGGGERCSIGIQVRAQPWRERERLEKGVQIRSRQRSDQSFFATRVSCPRQFGGRALNLMSAVCGVRLGPRILPSLWSSFRIRSPRLASLGLRADFIQAKFKFYRRFVPFDFLP